MSTYTIGEVADRTGFTTSALRYYEGIGLVAPTARTDGGYRLYDDDTVARLAFIARAKQLGCSLDEVTDLVSIWDGERCGPVQRRFHDLVTAKIADAQRQTAELVALTAQLQRGASQLAQPAVDGPCGDDCACNRVGDPGHGAAIPVALVDKPDDPPIACTLDATALPQRLSDWQAMLGQVGRRHRTADGALRLELPRDIDLEELVRLVSAEQQCCAFFAFTLHVDHAAIALEVRAPESADEIVAAVFGAPA